MPTSILPHLALTATVLFWGLSFIGTKIALKAFPPETLIFLRFSMGFLIFFSLLAARGLPRIPLRDHLKLFATALFLPVLYFFFETKGLSLAPASSASLIIATIPIFVTLASALFLKEAITARVIFSIGLSLCGVALLVLGSGKDVLHGGEMRGFLFMFLAVLAATGYMMVVKLVGQNRSPLEITTSQAFYGTLFYAPGFASQVSSLSIDAIGLDALAALACLTLFCTVGAFLCYNYALTRIEASRAALCLNAIPLVTTVGAWVILGETLAPLQIAGGVLVVTSVVLAGNNATDDSGQRVQSSLTEESTG